MGVVRAGPTASITPFFTSTTALSTNESPSRPTTSASRTFKARPTSDPFSPALGTRNSNAAAASTNAMNAHSESTTFVPGQSALRVTLDFTSANFLAVDEDLQHRR